MNSLNFVYYRVEIDGSGFVALPAPQDGFIDNTNTLQYAAASGMHPSTLADAFAKERANARWEEVVIQTQQILSPISVGQIAKAGSPTADDPPISIAFTIGYDREDYVYTHNTENSPAGVDLLTGEAAIRRMVARALMVTKSGNRDIYNPELKGENPQGMMYFDIDTGALTSSLATAEAAVTVTKIPNV